MERTIGSLKRRVKSGSVRNSIGIPVRIHRWCARFGSAITVLIKRGIAPPLFYFPYAASGSSVGEGLQKNIASPLMNLGTNMCSSFDSRIPPTIGRFGSMPK